MTPSPYVIGITVAWVTVLLGIKIGFLPGEVIIYANPEEAIQSTHALIEYGTCYEKPLFTANNDVEDIEAIRYSLQITVFKATPTPDGLGYNFTVTGCDLFSCNYCKLGLQDVKIISASSWNSPSFVLPKNGGNFGIVHDIFVSRTSRNYSLLIFF